jgi:poly(hydroxyalkanoate) granule-associated protein
MTTATENAKDTARNVKDTAKKVQHELLESAHKVWLAGLGAMSTIGDEGDRLFRELVEKGRTMETRGKEEAGEVREKVESRVKDVRGRVEERMRGARERVEKGFDSVWGAVDDRVAEVLHRMGVPTRDEIQRLTRRVEELNGKIDHLRGKPAGAAAKAEAERTVYHVAPHDDGWKVEREGASRATSTHETKDEALTAARELARSKAPGAVVVHRKDGTIQTSYSYDDEPAN